LDRYVEESHGDDDSIVVPNWTRPPFPQSWEEFERGVNQWLDLTWGPDWRCPQCGNRFWMVLETVSLAAATAWPGREGPNTGAYQPAQGRR
jgi:hypothetical protein